MKVLNFARKINTVLSFILQSYEEHHLTLEELRDIHPDSYIDLNALEKSDGLSSDEARFAFTFLFYFFNFI